MVYRSFVYDALVLAPRGGSDRGRGHRAQAAISPYGPAQARDGARDWPASTIGDILKQASVIEPVKRRRRPLDPLRKTIAAEAPSEEWAADFKGWFRTQDQRWVDLLTITDSATRFLIETRISPRRSRVRNRSSRAPSRHAVSPLRSAATTARRSARRAWAAGPAFGLVAQARRGAALHPPYLAAGERTA
jgi:hypothetical protein